MLVSAAVVVGLVVPAVSAGAASASLSAAATAAPTTLLDYQSGSFAQWSERQYLRSAQQAIVTTPARAGYPRTARFTVAPGDYTSTPGTLTFTTGQLSKTVNVPKTPEWQEAETGVPAKDVRALAREWGRKRGYLAPGGWGNGHGGACRNQTGIQWARVMVCLRTSRDAPGHDTACGALRTSACSPRPATARSTTWSPAR